MKKNIEFISPIISIQTSATAKERVEVTFSMFSISKGVVHYTRFASIHLAFWAGYPGK